MTGEPERRGCAAAPTGRRSAPDRPEKACKTKRIAPFGRARFSGCDERSGESSDVPPLADCDRPPVAGRVDRDAPRCSPGGCAPFAAGVIGGGNSHAPERTCPSGASPDGRVGLRAAHVAVGGRAGQPRQRRDRSARRRARPRPRPARARRRAARAGPGGRARGRAVRGAQRAGHRGDPTRAPRRPARPAARRPRRLPAAPVRRRRAGGADPAAAAPRAGRQARRSCATAR